MTDRDAVLISVYRAIDTVNEQLPDEDRVEKAPNAALYGDHGKLDSLGLITLMFAVEKQIETDFGKTISLAAESSLAPGNNSDDPFRRVDLLVDWLTTLLSGHRVAA